MNILLVHNTRIPVFAYGGTERVLWDLGKALVEMGHQVTFLVPEGSRCDFAHVVHWNPQLPVLPQVPAGFDVVHFQIHPGIEPDYPYLVTEHGNSRRPRPFPRNTVFVSQNHAHRYGATEFVHNGLDWSNYAPFDPSATRDRYHFLGKGAWPVKNLRGAIKTALTAGVELNVLGARRLNFSHEFRYTLSRRIHFHGMVGGSQKFGFLQQSKGMIFPVRWHEPFGLAIVESLYYGAPVFATPYGALPEIVTSETGTLATDMDSLVESIQRYDYDPRTCHHRAVNHFSHVQMAHKYVHYYERVIANEVLHAQMPILPVNGRQLIDWH
ncbi:MAG: glycosyltransferase [Hydrogenophaga sp.]|nr:glycosyltransferase [Hydrogenophaga sp.]